MSRYSFGVISGSGNVVKRESGTVAFFETHTFTGVMSIETGTLLLTNAGSIAASNVYGSFSFTNSLDPDVPQSFYRLQVP